VTGASQEDGATCWRVLLEGWGAPNAKEIGMTREALSTIAVLLTVSACAAEPVLAQPEDPHWLRNGTIIPVASPVSVDVHGSARIKIGGMAVKCRAAGRMTVKNPANGGPGAGSVSAFALTACASKTAVCPPSEMLEVATEKLPWPTRLVPGTPIRDELIGAGFALQCSGKLEERLRGMLLPEVGTSMLRFGAGSSELTSASGARVTIPTGRYLLVGSAAGEVITAA
jgi:hypothetical protein